MKKLVLLFLMALPVVVGLSSCGDDDDMPQVNISFTYENGAVVDGQVYVVRPDTLIIASVNVTAIRPNHVAACVGPVNYWLDGRPIGSTFIAPFGIGIPSEAIELGQHTLSVNMGVAEEGYSLATAMTSIKINVVDDSADIPVHSVEPTNEMTVPYTF